MRTGEGASLGERPLLPSEAICQIRLLFDFFCAKGPDLRAHRNNSIAGIKFSFLAFFGVWIIIMELLIRARKPAVRVRPGR